MIMALIGTDMIVDMALLKLRSLTNYPSMLVFFRDPLATVCRVGGDKKTAFELHVKARVAISLNLLKNRKIDLKREINSYCCEIRELFL